MTSAEGFTHPFTLAIPDLQNVIYRKGTAPAPSYITAPFDYLHGIPSNNHNIRLTLLHAFNEAFFQVEDARVVGGIGDVVGTLHEASLLIDDIEDESDMRRGRPAAHTQFGHALTINAGNYMYFLACHKAACMLPTLASQPNDRASFLSVKHRVSSIVMEEMLRIHTGQGKDLHWRHNLASLYQTGVPHPEEYLVMAMDKTGGLLRLSVELLSVFSDSGNKMGSIQDSKAVEDCQSHGAHDSMEDSDSCENHVSGESQATALANLIGIIYQIRDDYLNLVDPRYAEMKGLSGEDLAEGTLSLPVLFALSCSTDSPVHRLLLDFHTSQERLSQPDLLQQALKYIKACGALQYSYNLLQEYSQAGQKIVAESGMLGGLKLTRILQDLADVVVPNS